MGRVRGHRGNQGELTVDVARGNARFWVTVDRVWIEAVDGANGRMHRVESSRAYRDRLVLKLVGLDDPDRVARLRGHRVMVRTCDAPPLPAGEYHLTELVGLDVHDESGRRIGTVREVQPTGGVDLLVVTPAEGVGAQGQADEEVLIPLARSIVVAVLPEQRRIVVRPPAGLLDLNRARRGGPA